MHALFNQIITSIVVVINQPNKIHARFCCCNHPTGASLLFVLEMNNLDPLFPALSIILSMHYNVAKSVKYSY